MANSKLPRKDDYSTMNIKNITTRSGRKSTQFNVSFTRKTKEYNITPVSKTAVSTGKKCTLSKTPQSKRNSKEPESHNSPISDLEISDIINSSDITEKNLSDEKTHARSGLRCRKRIDYAEMFRGSSIINKLPNQQMTVNSTDAGHAVGSGIINEKVPIVLLTKLPDQEKKVSSNKTVTQSPKKLVNLTKKRHKIYSTIHSYKENIRPSQVYEFKFDSKCESELTKKFKKEAKVLKKRIKAKTRIKNAVKTDQNNKTTQAKNVLKILHEIPENDCSTNNFTKTQLMNKTRISDSFGKSFKAPQSTPKEKGNLQINKSPEICRENDLITNQVNSVQKNLATQIDNNSNEHELFDKVENSFKAPQSTSIQNVLKMLNKSQISKDKNINHKGCGTSQILNETNLSNLDVTQIENDFNDLEDISMQSNRTEIINVSIPWRAEIPKIRKERFFKVKNSSLPSYNQDIIITPQDVGNLSSTNRSICVNNEKKTRQTSILSFVQSSNSNNNRKDSPAPLTNSFESSLSDISIEDNPKIVAIDNTKNKRINFQKAITSSPTVKKIILGENNSSLTVQNISTNKSNIKTPLKKILGENNSSYKVQSNTANKDVYDENNKENFYVENNVNITNNCVIELEKSNNSSCDFFGFNSFEQEEARKSKKPFRYPSLMPVISSRTKKILRPFIVHGENIDILNEKEMNKEPIDILNENDEAIDANFQLFDEPRFSNYERRSYAPAIKRKRKQIQSIAFSDDEDDNELQQQVKKRKKNKKTKKEEEEFKKWAKQFNSMCQEVEKEELIID